MTSITYDRERLHLRMEGHAGSGAYGHDLVCAGLSTLLRVLMIAYETYGGELTQCEPGCADIALNGDAARLMDTVAATMEWLAQEYPEHCSFARVGGG